MRMSISQILSFIKSRQFQKNSDDLGTYFNKGDARFSCMKHGTQYICYHNEKSNEQWTLISKSEVFNDFHSALLWVYQQIEKQY